MTRIFNANKPFDSILPLHHSWLFHQVPPCEAKTANHLNCINSAIGNWKNLPGRIVQILPTLLKYLVVRIDD